MSFLEEAGVQFARTLVWIYQGLWQLHDTRAKKRAGSLAADPAHLGNHLFEKHSLETADPLRAVSA